MRKLPSALTYNVFLESNDWNYDLNMEADN